jgi:hypothetical protein
MVKRAARAGGIVVSEHPPDTRPLPGPTKADCPCNCGAFGVINKRTGHVRRVCPCRKCQGGRNRKRGLEKQRKARRAIGIPDAKYGSQLSDEENWNGPVRAEVKSGKQVGGLGPFFRAEKQSEQSRAIGDSRPFIFIAMPEGMGDEGVVMIRLSVWRDRIAPLIEEGP